jgi:hypothetical protein
LPLPEAEELEELEELETVTTGGLLAPEELGGPVPGVLDLRRHPPQAEQTLLLSVLGNFPI